MNSQTALRRRKLLRMVAIGLIGLVTLIVVWIDIQTSLWAEVVVLSGITAGIVTFLFTALFLDRIIDRAEQQRWLPVTHLAVTDLIHGLAQPDSEVTRGDIKPRYLQFPNGSIEDIPDETVERLLAAVTKERTELATLLARWSAFLAVSADAQVFMGHMAEVTFDLDAVRDAVIAFEEKPTEENAEQVRESIKRYNSRVSSSVEELKLLLVLTADSHVDE